MNENCTKEVIETLRHKSQHSYLLKQKLRRVTCAMELLKRKVTRTLFTTTKDNIVNYQLLDLGEYGMKNSADRGKGVYTARGRSINLHIIRKPNPIIVLLFIYNISKSRSSLGITHLTMLWA